MLTVSSRWRRLQAWLGERFGAQPGLEGILFLVGIQARGYGFEPDLDKDAKQALIMEGTYCVFETLGVYERVGMEQEGHWIWKRLIAQPPNLSIDDQEKLLRTAILQYFDDFLEGTESYEA